MRNLDDRLRRLAQRAVVVHPASPRPAVTLEHVIPGTWSELPEGRCYRVENSFAATFRHGGRELEESTRIDPSLLGSLAFQPVPRPLDVRSALFLDVETMGLSRGAGNLAFLVGLGSFEGAEFRVRQYFVPMPAEEPALLHLLTQEMETHEGLITFNGRSFDWPILSGRFVLNAMPVPWEDPAHFDLLLLCRRLWRDRLSSCSLGSLEEHVLSVERASEDIPGALIPQIYHDYLVTSDARPLEGVFYHNMIDVLSMVSLLQVAAGMAEAGAEASDYPYCDYVALGRLYEALDEPEKATSIYRRGGDAPDDARRWTALWRESMLHKRLGHYDEAMRLWSSLVDGPRVEPYIELAKQYEHRLSDVPAAIHWTRQGLLWLDTHAGSLEPWRERETRDALNHRLERLERRNTPTER